MGEKETINFLIKRLESYSSYKSFESNKHYDFYHTVGEMDLFAVRNNGVRVYFEIKNSFKDKHFDKAINQFERAFDCNQADKFVLVRPSTVKRCYV